MPGSFRDNLTKILAEYSPATQQPFAGNSLGMAWTHGWMAGKFAAKS